MAAPHNSIAIVFILIMLLSSSNGFLSAPAASSRFPLLLSASRGPADNDFISSFFSKFLPTPESMGLSRYDRNSCPESFPCVKDEFAALLPSDKDLPEKAIVRQCLAKTNLEFRDLILAYDANRDGWNKDAFHQRVDKKGPAIVLAKSKSGGVFGGYNAPGWVNYGEYRGSIAAFLFYYPNGDVKNQKPVKLAKIGGAGLAQIDDGQGPRFGSEGLTILLEKSRPKIVRCKLGLYYERMPDGTNTFLPGGKMDDELSDLKIFVGKYVPDEKIPYSDALPFALN